MSAAEWRSAGAYEDLRSLDAPAFAFEFLRRNPEFLKDHARLARKSRHRALDPKDTEAFAQRWGLRFRPRITQASRNRRTVDGQSIPGRRHPGKGDGRADKS
jgi:hypothetical protein